MRIVDTFTPQGPGILVLQDHRPKPSVHQRMSILATRVVDREELGALVADDEVTGDLVNGLMWPVGAGRELPAWSFVFPAVTQATAGGGGTSAPQITRFGDGAVAGAAAGAANQGKNQGKKGGILAEGGAFGFGGGGYTDPRGVGNRGGVGVIYVPDNGNLVANTFSRIQSPFGIFPGGSLYGLSHPDNRGIGAGKIIPAGSPGATSKIGVAEAAWFREGGEDKRVATDIRPTRTLGWLSDGRFRPIRASSPEGWPDFPERWHGVTVMGTDEKAQVEFFHPTDPRLVSPNAGGPRTAATLVCDLDGDDSGGKPDIARHARLSGFLRVIRNPTNSPGHRNALGWNLYTSGQGDVRGGYVIDKDTTKESVRQRRGPVTPRGDYRTSDGRFIGGPTGPDGLTSTQRLLRDLGILQLAPGSTGARTMFLGPNGAVGPGGARGSGGGATVIGMASILDGGPFDVGGASDIHRKGRDADGNPINSLHISTEALFRDRFLPYRDGPKLYEGPYVESDEWEYDTRVYHEWDAAIGMWRWRTTVPIGWVPDSPGDPPPPHPPTPGGPTTPPPDPSTPDPSRPITPGGDPDGTFGGNQPPPIPPPPPSPPPPPTPIGPWPILEQRRGFQAAHAETAFTAILARPQLFRRGEPDLRNVRRMDRGLRRRVDATTPVVGRLEAWGAQGGTAGGPYLDESGRWSYTSKPGRAPYGPGTAPGGYVFLPPEVRLEHIDVDLVPAGDLSASYLGVGPGARLFAGVPDLATGGVKDGWSIYTDGTRLLFASHSSVAAATDRFAMLQKGLVHPYGALVTTTGSQGDNEITYAVTQITTAPASAVATLPSGAAGLTLLVINNGANAVSVYPQSGGEIDGGGVDNPDTLNAGLRRRFTCIGGDEWVAE